MACRTNPVQGSARAGGRSPEGPGRIARYMALVILAAALIAIVPPGAAAVLAGNGTGPETVQIGVYILDFNRIDVSEGTVEADFYVTLKSGTNVSLNDLELMNGMITSVATIRDSPEEKMYRVNAVLTNEPDLSRYPFDRHTLPIEFEPKLENESEMTLVIDNADSGIYSGADVPGWTLTGTQFTVTNERYSAGEVPYSHAVFAFGAMRDETSTILKFFLPLFLIIIVSLSSLVMKTSSRLGLNASMFLAAVLIHWRIADSVPNVMYATFLDLFMIVTYATLVMVLISGVLILRFTETGDMARVDRVHFWSLRLIPPVSIALYILIWLSIVVTG